MLRGDLIHATMRLDTDINAVHRNLNVRNGNLLLGTRNAKNCIDVKYTLAHDTDS